MNNNGKMNFEDDMGFEIEGRSRGGSKFVPFLLGAIVGGTIGAALAMLFAPAEGSSLRREISEKLEDVARGAKDIMQGVRTTAENFFSDEIEAIDDSLTARTREKADDIIEDADRAIAQARRRSSERFSQENPENWEDDGGDEA
jgi:gas vesicle protein